MGKTLILTSDPKAKTLSSSMLSIEESDFSSFSCIAAFMPECIKSKENAIPMFAEVLRYRLVEIKKICSQRYDSAQDAEELYKKFESTTLFVDSYEKSTGKNIYFYIIEG
jgi:hypothetical protein